MEMEKKNLAIIILAVVLAASGIGNVILAITAGLITTAPSGTTVIYGYGSNPAELDPVDTWDVPSHIIQHQITQSLVEYDLSSYIRTDEHNYTLKPVLAESWTNNSDGTEWYYTLRENVYFHDNTLMTAEDVKWNFDRVQWLINASGDLPENETSWLAFPSSLYFFSDGTPIFDHFIADDEIDPLNFTIVLTAPFGALNDLLAFGATNILSPESTPRYTYLDLTRDKLVGTGPYEYVHFKRDKEVRLKRSSLYWGFPGYFETAVIKIIEDDTARMTAGLAGQFDYVGGVPKTYIDLFDAESDFHVENVGEDLCYFYLEIYSGPDVNSTGHLLPGQTYQSQKNNATLRRALALAVNYSYILEEIQSGYAVEGTPAVPRAMPGHNASVVQASDDSFTWEDNIEKARALMMSMYPTETAGLLVDFDEGTNDAAWKALPALRTLGINRHSGSLANERLNTLLTTNFDLIAIHLDETIRTWSVYLKAGQHSPWDMDIGYIGWCPDYLNPFNMIDPLFNLASGSCFSRINDTTPVTGLTALMEQAAGQTGQDQLDTYGDIQSLIYDIERPVNPASHAHISGWVFLVQQTHKTSLKGVQYNVMTMVEISKWYRED